MKVAILGYGTVGSAVVKFLLENQKLIRARCGKTITPVIALTRSPKKNALIPTTQSVDEILNADVDVFVELMGGVDETFKIVSQILKKKKAVVTANKAMLAYHRYELENLAKNIAFGYEASVAGGIPIIKVLKEGLSANNILTIKGILNGTSNYILSSMTQKNMSFSQALEKAQSLGYAEADPSFDIQGQDAAHKLLVLSSIAYNLKAKPEDILIEGISQITPEDIYFANEFELSIKLLGIAKVRQNKVELRVHPTMINKDTMLAKVDGVMNAISIKGDLLGESLYYGAGAGGEATASAVISDLMDIAKDQIKSPMLGFVNTLEYELLNKDEIYTKYYLRIKVEDKIGVLSKITQLMSQNHISIDSFLQKPKKDDEKYSTLFFTTHFTYEKSIQNLLGILHQQDFIKTQTFMMRIE
ncbi:homoserine dehydrogenase [Campylobacter sp. VicNov18]|uniref:homoserine dehydrogenase n=1 Tax=Campylobacter bilis TaxID=2691918 RepID=UPI00130E6260|nr:homoserine dehydrogenase [Campylobacter bilis]MPV63001.1 homoserine dehydrogenase [Campylobacter hepaticus]MBM0636500.1 homoserine dehydrogenase [Campylobacter bilis]MCC8277211.1 homoserine dehydrogenase [Campylobacter bilis]MCC8298954.1 homoserine dehydrogenase [Campylobacter bilis]MCC8300120.1 homoserine dehydrogenase [Campylobacter bilis]